ncbi:UbiA family prenyltransferase [Mesorhizobium sp. CAU 1741]|uniref:UbiA family prenyltransferase n=1 Tax=Mesorhizobium sp. CAU 1741 TaxID=3140366 RepID=UPI00325A6F07
MNTADAIAKPLIVDLDGTLVRSDLLLETAFAELGQRPQSIVDMLRSLRRGKAALKHRIAEPYDFDPSVLPYDQEVLALIHQARSQGRQVYLASASTTRLVEAIADHLGVFDGWISSDEMTNLSGAVKAAQLVERFGERGFDYIGNDKVDLAVWKVADGAIARRASPSVRRALDRISPSAHYLDDPAPSLRVWAKLIRVHQWAKNGLVFLPLITAQQFEIAAAINALLAFIAFSLCASGVYVLNDLVDLGADRAHPSKKRRPLASGDISLWAGVAAIPVLLAAAALIAIAVSWMFLAALLAYLALTTAYTFYLKRKFLVDVVALSMLYSARVLGGAVAIGASVSEWLLAFSMFIFTALALIKRYSELAVRLDSNLPNPSNRNYQVGDLDIVMAMAASSGFNAVTVLALYVSSDYVKQHYGRPEVLWLLCPILMYWIGRALMQSHRRLMHDDPVVFALKDRVSRQVFVLVAVIVAIAIWGG